jgi:ribonucleoside-diphosphate reductase alpha chain
VGLPSRQDLSYTCVLSSINIAKYDEWSKDDMFLHDSFIMLNAINELFTDMATKAGWRDNLELARTLKFAKEYRAVGMGVLGYHTYLQSKSIPFSEQEKLNKQLFQKIQSAGEMVSRGIYQSTGLSAVDTPGRYNYALCAVAPTLSTSLIQGGVSQGIEPVFSNAYTQAMAGGTVNRVNPILLHLLKSKGKGQQPILDDIVEHDGSVQHLDWLSDHERSVFKTGFEIDQMQIIRHASARQPYIDQMQSINLFNCNDQKYMSDVHSYAWSNDNIHSLYYLHPSDKVRPVPRCESCEG